MVLPIRFLISLALLTFLEAVHGQVEVDVRGGKVKGYTESDNVGETLKFLAIPYAEPPIGKLRFKPPVPKKSWGKAVIDEREYGSACKQDETWVASAQEELRQDLREAISNSREDCLTLNIHVPGTTIDKDRKDKLAVMVWIHGGAYMFGSASLYRGHSLAAIENVIVVTINYRLGIFGFLTTGDDRIPGNMGLMDQSLALKWVQQNIGFFGGDKDKVTIFGESSGAMSVTLQIVSPHSQGLFKRAIAQSGAETSRILFERDYLKKKNVIKPFAGNLSCWREDTDDIVECLQKASASEILNLRHFQNGPIVDGPKGFLPRQPSLIWAEKDFQPVGLLAGVLRDDGNVILKLTDYLLRWEPGNFLLEGMDFEDVKKYVHEYLIYTNPYLSKKNHAGKLSMLTDLILDHYFLNPTDVEANVRKMLDFYTDSFFTSPTRKALNIMSRFGQYRTKGSYMYYLTHRGQLTPVNTVVEVGPVHGEDVQYLWGDYIQDGRILYKDGDNDEKRISRSMTRAWATFAKTG